MCFLKAAYSYFSLTQPEIIIFYWITSLFTFNIITINLCLSLLSYYFIFHLFHVLYAIVSFLLASALFFIIPFSPLLACWLYM